MKLLVIAAMGMMYWGIWSPAKNTVHTLKTAAMFNSSINDTTPSQKKWDTTKRNYDTARKKRDTLNSAY